MIYVVRHGQSTVNVGRVIRCKSRQGDLTALGREQAQKAGKWLLGKGITKIRCSPFERTQETAAIIGEILKIESIMMDEDLCEVDCGEALEGSTGKESWKALLDVYERLIVGDRDVRFDGDGEAFDVLYARMSRALLCADDNTLVVTHGGVMRIVIPHLFANGGVLQITTWVDNTGFVLLEKDVANHGYSCISWNLCEHLDND